MTGTKTASYRLSEIEGEDLTALENSMSALSKKYSDWKEKVEELRKEIEHLEQVKSETLNKYKEVREEYQYKTNCKNFLYYPPATAKNGKKLKHVRLLRTTPKRLYVGHGRRYLGSGEIYWTEKYVSLTSTESKASNLGFDLDIETSLKDLHTYENLAGKKPEIKFDN